MSPSVAFSCRKIPACVMKWLSERMCFRASPTREVVSQPRMACSTNTIVANCTSQHSLHIIDVPASWALCFVQPENLQVQVWNWESRLGPHLHPHNIGWKAVEGKLLTVQYNMEVAPKAHLEVGRSSCKMGYDTLRCSATRGGLFHWLWRASRHLS